MLARTFEKLKTIDFFSISKSLVRPASSEFRQVPNLQSELSGVFCVGVEWSSEFLNIRKNLFSKIWHTLSRNKITEYFVIDVV